MYQNAEKPVYSTWVEVDSSAISNNVSVFKSRLSPGTKFMAVVKGLAYGHNPLIVAAAALKAGADWLGVNSVDEALELNEAGVAVPILVLGYVPPGRYRELANTNISLTMYNPEDLEYLASVAVNRESSDNWRPRIHVKVETGLNRQGIFPSEAIELLKKAAGLGIVPEGAHTHFANIEDTTEHEYARKQLDIFGEFAAESRKLFPDIILHTSCSAAALLFSETHYDMVRAGIGIYGLWPSRETRLTALLSGDNPSDMVKLEPALTWKAVIAQVKPLFAGDRVGYGCSHVVTRDGLGAVIPVGYYEGFDRSLSMKASVLVGGRRCPVLGRVCMNMFVADVSHVPGVKSGDPVVLIGGQGDEYISAEEMAALAGTINYEVITRINSCVPRIEVQKTTAMP